MSDDSKPAYLWDHLKHTDPAYTKSFDNGSFKGTAVNPSYNIGRITEKLGPAGRNWGFHVVNQEMHSFPGADGDLPTVVHSCVVQMWFLHEDGNIRHVDGIGTTKMAYVTGKGRYFVDAEAPKKSQTDAMSKCMLILGASVDVWFGWYEDKDYRLDMEDRFADDGRDDNRDNNRNESRNENRNEGQANNVAAPLLSTGPLRLLDPAGRKPASFIPMDRAAEIIEKYCQNEATSAHMMEVFINVNKAELKRIGGLIEVIEGYIDQKEGGSIAPE